MQRKGVLKTKGFCLVSFLLIVFIIHPLNLFGQEDSQEKVFKVEVKDNLIAVNVKEAELSDVLQEIGKKANVKLTISKNLSGKKITAYFENLDAETVLKEILQEYFYVFTFIDNPANKEKHILKEVRVESDVIGTKPYKGKMFSVDIPYGSGVGEVGVVDAGEGAMGGPPSFAVDDIGNIFILDPLNKRIQIFSKQGVYLSSMPLKITACDIAIDKHGFIYVYHCGDGIVKKLYQYKKDGDIVAVIDVDASRWNVYDAPISIVNNNIYIDTCNYNNTCGFFLIGRILAGNILGRPSFEESKTPKVKRIGLSGREYTGEATKGVRGELKIKEQGIGIYKTISLPLKNILSIQFMAEDTSGNLFVKTDRDDENYKLVEEFHNFSANGDYLRTIKMSGSNIHFRSTKNYDLSKDGTIYQFLPETDKLRLNIFPVEENQ
ncbi:MAG: hypothetical protein WA126_02080 [Thermodesulfovibrionales bacterium]